MLPRDELTYLPRERLVLLLDGSVELADVLPDPPLTVLDRGLRLLYDGADAAVRVVVPEHLLVVPHVVCVTDKAVLEDHLQCV